MGADWSRGDGRTSGLRHVKGDGRLEGGDVSESVENLFEGHVVMVMNVLKGQHVVSRLGAPRGDAWTAKMAHREQNGDRGDEAS